MTVTLAHKIVAYDKKTEWYAQEYDVPAQHFALVKRVAGVAKTDPDAVGNYPLSPSVAEEIARIIGITIDSKRFTFYLEPAPVDE